MSATGPEAVLARVLRSDTDRPEPVGVAFMVGRRHLLSCSHVINAALGRDETSADKPDQPVRLDFPLLDGQPDATATVQVWQPLAAAPQMGLIEDIAVLELQTAVTGATAATLLDPNEHLEQFPTVCAPGVPSGADNGEWGHAKVGGLVGSGWLQLDAEPGHPRIRQGYSGGPLWDDRKRWILGMVVAELERDGLRLSYIIPNATLHRAWAQLAFVPSSHTTAPAPDGPVTATLTLTLDDTEYLHIEAPARFGLAPRHVARSRLQAATTDPGSLFELLFEDRDSAARLCPPPTGDPADSASSRDDSAPPAPHTGTLYLHCGAPELLDQPWHRLCQDKLLGPGWTVIPHTSSADAARRTLTLPLDNPLIIAPSQHAIDLQAGAHIVQVTEALRPFLAHPSTPVRRLAQVDDLETALTGEPDLIYLFGRLDADGFIDLSDTPGGDERLSLERLSASITAGNTRPLLWLHLIAAPGRRPNPAQLQALLAGGRLLLLQLSNTAGLETSQRQTLDLLEHLAAPKHNPKRDPALSVARCGDNHTRLWMGDQDIRLQAPPKDGEPRTLQRIQAGLIRITLGRRPQSEQIAGGISYADGNILFYAVGGDAKACPHDFPEQLRRFLEKPPRRRHRRHPPGTRVRPRWQYATVPPAHTDPDTDPDAWRERLAWQFKQQLCIGPGYPPSRALADLAGGEPLPGETVVLSLPWLIELTETPPPQTLSDWLGAWKRAVIDVIHEQIPDDCIALVGACLQWPSHPQDADSERERERLSRINALLSNDNPSDVRVIELAEPLGRVTAAEVGQFYQLPWAKRRLRDGNSDIDPAELSAWTVGVGGSRSFEDTVQTIYRGLRTDHEDFRHHQQARHRS